MKSFALVALFVGVCTAQQQYKSNQVGNDIVITRSENENSGDGNFRWASELSDGTKLEQSGQLRDGPDPEHPIQVIQGSYSYTSPEGQLIELRYVADENGFQPEASHLPTPPPVPEAIQKAIDLILRNAENQPAQGQAQPQRPPPPPSNRQAPRQQQQRQQQRRF